MKKFFLVVLFFSGKVSAFDGSVPSHDAVQCRALESAVRNLLRNMNAQLGLDIGLEFVERGSQNPQEIEYNRRPNLMDSNARVPGIVQMPRPCVMAEEELPSKELFLFVLAHEYSHKIIDVSHNNTCEDRFWTRLEPWKRDGKWDHNHPLFMGSMGMQHNNVDILGLKFLSHFSIDQRKAFKDFVEYQQRNPQISEIHSSKCCMRSRLSEVEKMIPTDFSMGNDFFKGGFISQPEILNKFISNQYPSSPFVGELNSTFSDQEDGCRFASLENQQKASDEYNLTLRREIRGFEELMRSVP